MSRLAAFALFFALFYGSYRLNAFLIWEYGAKYILEEDQHIPPHSVFVLPGSGSYYSERPNFLFNGRVKKSYTLLKANPEHKIIISGLHNGQYAETSEMASALIDSGIQPSRILYDSAAYDSFQTILNLKSVNKGQTFIFVSQREHLSRMLWIARTCGLDAIGIDAPGRPGGSPEWQTGRERLACVKARLEVYYYLLSGKRWIKK